MPRMYFFLACIGCAVSLVAQTPGASQPILRADCSLVLIPTHVTTPIGKSITDLNRENFRLIEDSVEQTITHFSHDDAPVSIGLLFDISGSMRLKMQKASEAVSAFFKTANSEDEFFLVEFNDRAKLSIPFTQDSGEVYQRIAHSKPFGRTSLLDALHLALGQMKSARNARKAIVIFSDGGDNWSRHSAREVRNALLESDVLVYAIGIFDPKESSRTTREEKDGPELLSDLAEQSGGRHYPVVNLNDLPGVSTQIGIDLHDEYVLGYSSSNVSRDGKYRRVRVNLAIPETKLDLRIYHRRGYYAPLQ